MEKVLIAHKKEQVIAYVLPRHRKDFDILVKQSVRECKQCGDKKGLMNHIVNQLNRYGYKTLNLKEIERIRV